MLALGEVSDHVRRMIPETTMLQRLDAGTPVDSPAELPASMDHSE